MAGKFAEKLIILQDACDGLLARVYNLKKLLASPQSKPTILKDNTYSKLCKVLTQKFPESPSDLDKQQGYQDFMTRADEFRQELANYYYAFLDVLDFKEATSSLLEDMSKTIIGFKLEVSPDLMRGFMNLLVGYVKLQVLTHSLADRKTLLAFYSRAYYQVQGSMEPNYSRLGAYMNEFENPIKKLQDESQSVSVKVGDTIKTLRMKYLSWMGTQQIRKSNLLNPFIVPERQTAPVVEPMAYELTIFSEVTEWILWGYLVCPSELTPDVGLPLLEATLQYHGFVTTVYREENMNIYAEYEALFAWYKTSNFKLSKHKKLIPDTLTQTVNTTSLSHRERRQFLKSELTSMYHFLKDTPGLIAPKFQAVLCGLHMAKDEVVWYFKHLDVPPPKSKGKWSDQEFRDPSISDLVYIMDQLVELCTKHQRIIQQYYIEYLSGPHLRYITPLIEHAKQRNLDSGIMEIFQSAMNEMRSLNVSQVGTPINLEAFRLNWYRVVAHLSSAQAATLMRTLEDLTGRMNMISQHSRFVDNIEALLKEHSSLAGIFWYKTQLMSVFTQSLFGNHFESLHCMSFLRVLASSEDNVHHSLPTERTVLRQECTSFADEFLTRIMDEVEEFVKDIGNSYLTYSLQFSPVSAAEAQQQLSGKAATVLALPGFESHADQRSAPSQNNVRLRQKNLAQICIAMQNTETIVLYDHVYCPREYLREKLVHCIENFFRKIWYSQTEGVKQPSLILDAFNTVVLCFKEVEKYVNINVDEIVRHVLFSSSYKRDLGDIGTHLPANAATTFDEKCPLDWFTKWYVRLLTERIKGNSSSASAIFYSPPRRAFITAKGVREHVEYYCDYVELKAFCTLFGPQGVRYLENAIYHQILVHTGQIKEIIVHNQDTLNQFKDNYTREKSCFDLLKTMRLENVVSVTIVVGACLAFIDLLRDALNDTIQARTPIIHDCIRGVHRQYPTNTFMVQDLIPVDVLASDAGQRVGLADVNLKRCLQDLNRTAADHMIWQLLPFLYAASFTNAQWRGMEYRVNVEGHIQNAHCMSYAINQLIVTMNSLPIEGRIPQTSDILAALRKYLHASSYLLLRFKSTRTFNVENLPSMFVFLDKFVQYSEKLTNKMMTMSVLESSFPYVILRAQYAQLYESQKQRNAARGRRDVDDEN
eukprot:GFYU01002736.1.p1 GENE.GFYU01002736.1~~GFYU01002736.1.p1  ORF type:complete len:1155 (-),score=375.87 GFYU01002736.1:160-3624(-)